MTELNSPASSHLGKFLINISIQIGMSRGTLKLAIFVTFSSVFTVLTVLLAIYSTSSISVYNSGSKTVVYGASQVEFLSPFFPPSLGISVIGWLLTGYELFAERRKEISRIIRTTFSGKRDHCSVLSNC